MLFVYHTGNFYIASEGKPADAVNGIADLFLNDGKPGIKEEIEFLYPALEPAGRDIMTKFVQDDKDGERDKSNCATLRPTLPQFIANNSIYCFVFRLNTVVLRLRSVQTCVLIVKFTD